MLFGKIFKKNEKEVQNIKVNMKYYSKIAKTVANLEINGKKIKRDIISDVNVRNLSIEEQEKLLCPLPLFKITSILDSTLGQIHKVIFKNEFVYLDKYYLDQDAFNFYKIGVEILKELSYLKLINMELFKIEIVEGKFCCDFCNSGYTIIYKLYYNNLLIIDTKHNGMTEENNCPFLYNLHETDEDNLVINKNIILQLLFEGVKKLFKNKISFNLSEFYNYNDENEQKTVNLENLTRTESFDCCIGLGKGNVYKKAISIYNFFIKKNKNEMILIISNNYVKIKLENNNLNFYDINDFKFGFIKFSDKEKERSKCLNDINIVLGKKFNIVMSESIYK